VLFDTSVKLTVSVWFVSCSTAVVDNVSVPVNVYRPVISFPVRRLVPLSTSSVVIVTASVWLALVSTR
jgi:hypothetical protein